MALACFVMLLAACAAPYAADAPADGSVAADVTAPPDGEPTVRITEKHILSNIRRTLHQSGTSAFTETELELIRFVELRGAEVSDVSELKHLPNIETLLLKDTRVADLSSIAGCTQLHTLLLLENDALDYATLPTLPTLKLLLVTGQYSAQDIARLAARLPDCSIITDQET